MRVRAAADARTGRFDATGYGPRWLRSTIKRSEGVDLGSAMLFGGEVRSVLPCVVENDLPSLTAAVEAMLREVDGDEPAGA
jgi:hypothetical protein